MPSRSPEAGRGRARDRALLQLKTRGPQTADLLARRLGVSAVAVRQQLVELETEGLVSHASQRRGVGRPAKVWSLTAAAAERFPDAHADLTVDLLESMREAFGERGVDRLLAVRQQRALERYRSRVPEGGTLGQRVAALARLRDEEGYMAEWRRRRDGSFLLLENHCPICAAAAVCQGLCRDELRLFREVLGPDAEVERTEHLLDDARRCAYLIRPV